MTALAGLALAALLWWALKAFGQARPSTLARLPKMAGGVAALAVGGLLLLRGQLEMALAAGGVGAWLLGWADQPLSWLRHRSFVPPGSVPAQGPATRMRSATLDMQVDHASGRIGGTVLAGPSAGRSLDELGPAELRAVREICLRDDREGLRLIEPYLDRRFPGWREDAEPDSDMRRGADPKRSPMTEQEAYEVLGLQPGSGADAVRLAHRSLMKKLHPDHGGSTYLASRVNQAKDVLLNRHR